MRQVLRPRFFHPQVQRKKSHEQVGFTYCTSRLKVRRNRQILVLLFGLTGPKIINKRSSFDARLRTESTLRAGVCSRPRSANYFAARPVKMCW